MHGAHTGRDGGARGARVKICCVSLFAHHLFTPSSKSMFGGAELQLYHLATGLARDPRFDLYFIVGDFGQPEFEIRNGVKIYKCFPLMQSNRKGGLLYAFLRPGRILKFLSILKRIDADVYVQRASGRITGTMALFCRAFRKKFVYMAAHDADVQLEDTLHKGAASWMIFKMGLRSADLVVCQHESQADAVRAHYGRESVVRPSAHVIGPPPDVAAKDAVLWVARCDDWKQPELFIEMARRFPQRKFVMVCPEANDAQYFAAVRGKAAALPNVDFVDYVPFEQIDGFFARARCFVNTSRFEGFPNTFIQAAKGMAVILSLNIDPDNVLERHRMGICAKGDMGALVDSLDRLLTDGKLWNTMAQNAYRYVKDHHDLARIIERDKEMFLDLAAR